MSILDKSFLYKLKYNTIFIAIYTIVFILIYKTFSYIAPFLIGGIIAFIINPVSQKLKVKFRINKGVSTLILSFLAVAVVLTLASVFIMAGTKHLVYFLDNATQNSDYINDMIIDLTSKANVYIEYIQDVTNISTNINIELLITKYSTNLVNIAKSLLTSIISLVSSIPYIAIFIITLFIATYFIAKDIDKIENGFYNIFTEGSKRKVKNIKKEILISIFGYIKAYTILMGITFIITWISFSVLGVSYGTILGFIAAILDLIPFLGITIIYLPVIIYYWIVKNYFLAILIGIIFILLSLLRQILEPKLVSVNIGLSPLSTLAAIFIGVQVKGIIGIIFCLGLVIMHQILKKVDIL